MQTLKPEDIARHIPPGTRLFVGSGAGCPHALMRYLCARAQDLSDVTVHHLFTLGPTPWAEPGVWPHLQTHSFFLGESLREGVRAGRVDYTPVYLSELPDLFEKRVVPLDVAFVQCTPADAQGYYSLGVSVDVIPAACRAARLVVAQINPRMPRTLGESFLHAGEIGYALEVEEPLPELARPQLDDAARRIGAYVAQLVDHGATLQLGMDHVAWAVAAALLEGGHRDLGLHTEVLTDAAMDLIEAGVINNRRKSLHRGISITSFAMGSQKLYDFLDSNPHIALHPSEYVNNPTRIAANDRMVAINGALQVDLTGQVVSDSLGHPIHSGVGGQVDFIRGAAMSREGKPIIALPATDDHHRISRIVPRLDEGAGVMTTRGDVHYVVTEYGVATLRGRSIQERAYNLIQIAHPGFRSELLDYAHRHGLIPTSKTIAPQPVKDLGDVETRRITLKDGTYLLRPLHPSDERILQDFFYSHSPETIYHRYGFILNSMTRERAYKLVSVDQNKDLALGVFETRPQGARDVLHAVGRYFLDDGGKSAEMAFVVRESKRRTGMGSALFNALAERAHARGLEVLWAYVLPENAPMLNLFSKMHCELKSSDDGQSISVVYRLKGTPGAHGATRTSARGGTT